MNLSQRHPSNRAKDAGKVEEHVKYEKVRNFINVLGSQEKGRKQ